MQEIESLKGNQGNGNAVLSRPGTASAEVAQVRQERDKLLMETKNL
jgi:hypothetical protein